MLVIRTDESTTRTAIPGADWSIMIPAAADDPGGIVDVRNNGGFVLTNDFNGQFSNSISDDRFLEAFINGAVTVDAGNTQYDPPGTAPAVLITGSTLEISPSNSNLVFWRIPAATLNNIVGGTRFTLSFDIAEFSFISDHIIYPADRCTWHQINDPSGNGYSITNAQFYPGHAAATDLPGAQLGYIGKSGRFVEIAS